jgi:hypothetical protein
MHMMCYAFRAIMPGLIKLIGKLGEGKSVEVLFKQTSQWETIALKKW